MSNARPKINVNKVPRWVFRYVGNKTFDFSSKKRIFCSKTTKFSLKLAFLSIAGSFCALLVGWLGVVARAVSRKTPIYFMNITFTLEVNWFCCRISFEKSASLLLQQKKKSTPNHILCAHHLKV